MEGTLRPTGPHPAHGERARRTTASRSACSRRRPLARDALAAGDVGFVIAGIKELKAARVGDTVTLAARPAASRCPASRKSSRRCSPDSIRSRRTSTRRCATRSRSSSSTTRRCTTSPRSRRRSVSASAAASSACCTWTSCRSGSSASTTWTLVTTAPTVVYQVLLRDGTVHRDRESGQAAGPVARRGDPRADHHDDDPRAAGLRRPGADACAPKSAACRRTCNTSAGRSC